MDEGSEEIATPKSRKSIILTALGTLIVIIVVVLYVIGITYKPAYSAARTANSAITAANAANGQKTYVLHLAIQTTVGSGPHADWLGYQTETSTPHPGTVFNLPRNALVTVIVHNFDSQTAPRNPFFALVQGTDGGVEYVNGKKTKVMDPKGMSHTFTIPDFGVSVPMMGIPSNAKPNTFETMKFTFRTPDRKGVFSWQCIVPCGSGLYGNGGPMSEIGYMQGLITLS
jgi:hypothetical protein